MLPPPPRGTYCGPMTYYWDYSRLVFSLFMKIQALYVCSLKMIPSLLYLRWFNKNSSDFMNWVIPHSAESDNLSRGLAQKLIWKDQVSTPARPRLRPPTRLTSRAHGHLYTEWMRFVLLPVLLMWILDTVLEHQKIRIPSKILLNKFVTSGQNLNLSYILCSCLTHEARETLLARSCVLFWGLRKRESLFL